MPDTNETLDIIIENAIVAEYNEIVSIETAYFNEIVASLE